MSWRKQKYAQQKTFERLPKQRKYGYAGSEIVIKQIFSYSSSCDLTPAISRDLIGQRLIFAQPRNKHAVTHLKNVR